MSAQHGAPGAGSAEGSHETTAAQAARSSAPSVAQPPDGVHGVLGHLGFAPTELVAVCWLEGGRFRPQVVTVAGAPEVVARHADGDCWVNTQPLREGIEPGKRGSEADVVGARALRADFDVKPGAFGSLDAARLAVESLADVLGERPAVVVMSGHGLQPGWRLVGPGTSWTSPTSPEAQRARQLMRAWGRLVMAACEGWSAKADPVFDLSRVMRVPGTVNHKEPEAVAVTADVHVDEDADEPGITLDRLEAVLAHEGITLHEEDAEVLGAEVSGPDGWDWAERTCAYGRGWARGIARDKPVERHPWLLGQAVRLACAHRLGCLTEADYLALREAIAARFRTRLNVGKKRAETRGEVAAAFAWGVTKAATFTEAAARAELGGHVHPGAEQPPEHPAVDLDAVHTVNRRELGEAVDLQAVDAVLAVAASSQLTGDPTWLLVVGGSGVGKTETLNPLTAAGAVMASSISSEGALLSGTSAKERAADAHGGLLRRIGGRGLLVLKDVTTILSMQRDSRAAVLAALREVYDGRWDRHLGSDGGQTLTWQGHCTVIGGVTTAWDAAHGVVSAMGDRFILVRPRIDEEAAGRAALAASGRESEMRTALAAAAGGLLQHLDTSVLDGAQPPVKRILALANVVTWTRTAVERDYRGDVIDVHAREAPTRFAKQLLQLWRGARVIGLDDAGAGALVERVAADSMPPSRASVLGALHHLRGSSATTADIARAVQRPRTTVDQTLQALVALRLARVIEVPGGAWQWSVADAEGAPDAAVVAALVPGNVGTSTPSAQSARSAPAQRPF